VPPGVYAGHQHGGIPARLLEDHAPRCPESAVGERQHRLLHKVEQRVDAVDHKSPLRVLDDDRQLPRRRRASWSSSTVANHSGPPPSQTTPAGTPPGSTPTDTDVARWPSPTSNHESLPGRPPSGPSSSPAINTWFGAIPRRHSQCMIHRPESDLSVRLISTCLASLVTSDRPDLPARRRHDDLDRLREPADAGCGKPILQRS